MFVTTEKVFDHACKQDVHDNDTVFYLNKILVKKKSNYVRLFERITECLEVVVMEVILC